MGVDNVIKYGSHAEKIIKWIIAIVAIVVYVTQQFESSRNVKTLVATLEKQYVEQNKRLDFLTDMVYTEFLHSLNMQLATYKSDNELTPGDRITLNKFLKMCSIAHKEDYFDDVQIKNYCDTISQRTLGPR